MKGLDTKDDPPDQMSGSLLCAWLKLLHCYNCLGNGWLLGKQDGHPAGTVMTVEGPRFSSKAESHMFRLWGADVINMTTVPEVMNTDRNAAMWRGRCGGCVVVVSGLAFGGGCVELFFVYALPCTSTVITCPTKFALAEPWHNFKE